MTDERLKGPEHNPLDGIDHMSRNDPTNLGDNPDLDRIHPNHTLIVSKSENEMEIFDNAFSTMETITESLGYRWEYDKKNEVLHYAYQSDWNDVFYNHSYNGLVEYWKDMITKEIDGIKAETQSDLLNIGELIFRRFEDDKLILLSNTNHMKPRYCKVRNAVYKKALILSFFQEAIVDALSDMGVTLPTKYNEHKYFPRFIEKWSTIHSVFYGSNNDNKPLALTDANLDKMNDIDVNQRMQMYFNTLNDTQIKFLNESLNHFKSTGTLLKDKSYNVKNQTGVIRNTLDDIQKLQEATDWSDVSIKLVINTAGTFLINIKLKHWKRYRTYSPVIFELETKGNKPHISAIGSDFQNLAINQQLTHKGIGKSVNAFEKRISRLRKIFKQIFKINDNPISNYSKSTQSYEHYFGSLKMDGYQSEDELTMQESINKIVTESPQLKKDVLRINDAYQQNLLLDAVDHKMLFDNLDRFISDVDNTFTTDENIYPKPPEFYDDYIALYSDRCIENGQTNEYLRDSDVYESDDPTDSNY